MSPRRLVVAAAIVDDLHTPTTLLAARRTAPPALAGRWEFPGGKVEPDEDPVDALHRELREELDVAVELGAEIPAPDGGAWPITDRHDMRLWLARITRGTPVTLDAHDAVRWLPVGRWFDVPWLDADVPIVEALTAHLSTAHLSVPSPARRTPRSQP
ncbi:8-oxo-dGTP diphosphatase [Sediminihabitans luteus]|uniref:8-oxo-dGTP diphosphatase n=1 Tax=Sediminihabitans luteus TaxID=1138585 RepID=A0A2M9CCX0_9CELL|nr:(deoxy)nucleoside triphosphate pyrophosphohydrolase [Sediminihabitans luteus]PJJ69237.1 8-oxo-dGTP diphosphatase [Sediminihabitans luteus]GII98913.1 DNA mismatch repair protein MutT [Sediminihabitans luteus]